MKILGREERKQAGGERKLNKQKLETKPPMKGETLVKNTLKTSHREILV